MSELEASPGRNLWICWECRELNKEGYDDLYCYYEIPEDCKAEILRNEYEKCDYT